MINFSLFCKSNHWPARKKKVELIINKILKYKKDLHFSININYACSIILADDILLKKINTRFRNKKKSTDVLTFISDTKATNIKKQRICDIFLSADIIKKDAIYNNITFYDHLAHIFIHSFLHINGFEHKKYVDYKKMKKTEIVILSKLGIKNPYTCN